MHSVRSMTVQTAGDIVRLAIVLPLVPSFKSVCRGFQQGVLLDKVRLMCATQPGFPASSTIYVRKVLLRC